MSQISPTSLSTLFPSLLRINSESTNISFSLSENKRSLHSQNLILYGSKNKSLTPSHSKDLPSNKSLYNKPLSTNKQSSTEHSRNFSKYDSPQSHSKSIQKSNQAFQFKKTLKNLK